MIAGIGTDILKMSDLSGDYLIAGDPFLVKTYAPREIEQAQKRELPFYYYATRFAGKEAVFKSLGISPQHVRMSEIEIINDSLGVPHVTLYGGLLQKAKEKGIHTVHISLSYEKDYASAFAVAEIREEDARKERQ
ncbi:MAG: holo-ACP synthase [Eubacterium sp.]|nr:holo-ACP synthase [Eubacterium sp.]